MKPQEGKNGIHEEAEDDEVNAKMFKNNFAGSGQITPKKKVLE